MIRDTEYRQATVDSRLAIGRDILRRMFTAPCVGVIVFCDIHQVLVCYWLSELAIPAPVIGGNSENGVAIG